MTYQELIQSFKKKIYLPVYLLMGENDYYIDKVTDYIQDNFFENEGIKDFNLEIVYGKDTNVSEIVSLAKQFPMMSDYRVLIVKEAQGLEKTISDLLPYVQNPQKQTNLVLCYKYKNLDKRKVLYKNNR
jgi:DNA polymerase-3 subunit delta